MNWFYNKNGQQTGPVAFAEIERLHAEGELNGESLVWQQGTPTWVKLGTVLGAGGVTAPLAEAKTNTLSIVSLVLGILSTPLGCCTVGILTAIPAVICGHMALGQLKQDALQKGKGLAVAGLILGYLSIAIATSNLVFVFSGGNQRLLEWVQEQQQTLPQQEAPSQ